MRVAGKELSCHISYFIGNSDYLRPFFAKLSFLLYKVQSCRSRPVEYYKVVKTLVGERIRGLWETAPFTLA